MSKSIWLLILLCAFANLGGESSEMQPRSPPCQSWACAGTALRAGQIALHTTTNGWRGHEDVLIALNLRGGGKTPRQIKRTQSKGIVKQSRGGSTAVDELAEAKERLVKAESEVDAVKDVLRKAEEAVPVDAQRVAEAKLGVAKAELGVAKAELGVAKAELGVAEAKWQAALGDEKAVFLSSINTALKSLETAQESVRTANMAYEKALNASTATPLQGDPKLPSYKFVPQRQLDPYFTCDGFGPFTLERKQLRRNITTLVRTGLKGRDATVHITSSKASGKTTLLHMVGEDLVNASETVYFFENSRCLDRVYDEIKILDEKLNKRVTFLVDETQSNPNSEAFTFLLRKAVNIVTIGAGVPVFQSLSGEFQHQLKTSDLLFHDEDLENEGVFKYFVGNHTASKDQVFKLVSYLCQQTGGCVFPVMRLAELLIPMIKNGSSAKDQIAHYTSRTFRESLEFQSVCRRILPNLQGISLLQFFRSSLVQHEDTAKRLESAGFCGDDRRIISCLLVEAYFASLGTGIEVLSDLRGGVDGVEQILMFGLPRMEWQHYDQYGGAIEDALTFELLHVVARLAQIGTKLFNPKLVNVGTSARRPDMFFNDKVNTYVEALTTRTLDKTAREALDEHISRFYNPDNSLAKYQLQEGEDWGVLNFQSCGQPLKPLNTSFMDVFERHVFTFVMSTKDIFRGSTCISCSNKTLISG